MKKWIQNKSSDTWQALLFVLGRPSCVIRHETHLSDLEVQMLSALPDRYSLSVADVTLWASLASRCGMAPEIAEDALVTFTRARDQLKKPQSKQEELSHARG